jgi:hypothetical protein
MNSVACRNWLRRRRAVVSMCQWCSSTRDWRRERSVFWSETLGDRDSLVLTLDWLALPHYHQILLMTLQQHLLAMIIACCDELNVYEDKAKDLPRGV